MLTRSTACAFCLAIVWLGTTLTYAQNPGRPPIAKQGFMRAIGIGGLSEAELISFVNDRGVAFVLTPEERDTVLKAGHTQKLFDALTASYRGPNLRPLAPAVGPPATEEELLGWLRDGCDEESVEKAVAARGVGFPITAGLLTEVQQRGAYKGLVEWLHSRRLEAAKAALLTPAEPGPAPAPAPVKLPEPKPESPAPVVAGKAPEPPPVAPAGEPELYVVRRVKPVYPPDAKRGLSGAVRLKVLVNADGRVEQVNPIEGHPVLAAAAENAVRRWIYEPPTLHGKPSQVETVVKITFKAP